MQQLTSISTSILILQLLTVGFFAFLALLPTILRRWRGETTHDRHAQARAERERAELTADTAIAVKRAEMRAATEIMWAEKQLAHARLAVEAQTEIDRAQLRHRVNAAIEATTPDPAPAVDDIYLPIAAEAEAASLAAPQAIVAAPTPAAAEAGNLPAVVERTEYSCNADDSDYPRRHQSCCPLDPPTGSRIRGPRNRYVNPSIAHRAPGDRGG